jgi:hypothetical protein
VRTAAQAAVAIAQHDSERRRTTVNAAVPQFTLVRLKVTSRSFSVS